MEFCEVLDPFLYSFLKQRELDTSEHARDLGRAYVVRWLVEGVLRMEAIDIVGFA